MPGIDLHTHSNRSDGELPPADLVDLAARSGLEAVAITDHDTLEGLPQALEAGPRHGIAVVPGCELTVTDQDRRFHILGLYVFPPAPGLEAALVRLREARHRRNRLILEKLAGQGIHIAYQEVVDRAAGAVGRPHIAQIMVERGLVSSQNQAFRRYLGAMGRAYVPKEALPLAEASALIRAEGGTVVLAHPSLINLRGQTFPELIRHYRDLGVEGLEAYYSDHGDQLTKQYLEAAQGLGMLVSGGSDFHGSYKPDIRLGVGKGSLYVPGKVLKDLRAYRLAKGLAV
jgi:hypothetical protein